MAAKTRYKKWAVKIQHCPISSKFDMWVDNDVPNWFPTLKNFYRSPFSKWPPQYCKNSTLPDIIKIWYDKGRGTLVRSSFCLFLFYFVFLIFLYSFISSFFSIVNFLGWTRLHATWIKPEAVATKKYTGYLHYRFITTGSRFLWSPCCSYMCFF